MKHFVVADDGERIHVEVAGAGAPLVLLHGWAASHQEWSPMVATLAHHHDHEQHHEHPHAHHPHAHHPHLQVHRWDARGHGGHALTTATRPTVQRMAQDLRNLLDHFALHDAVLVGHSMGALTIWEYIRAYGTSGIRKLCLIDQSPRLVTDDDWRCGIYGDFDRSRADALVAELRTDFAEAVLRLTAYGLNARARLKYEENAKGWQRMRETLRKLDPAPLIDIWESLVAADYRDVLERIDVPTLLVWGGASNFYTLATAHYVHQHLRASVLHVYDDTDHSPHQWQRERFERDLLGFIAR